MSKNPPADTCIGNYEGQPIYVEDVLGAYAPKGIPIEDKFFKNFILKFLKVVMVPTFVLQCGKKKKDSIMSWNSKNY